MILSVAISDTRMKLIDMLCASLSEVLAKEASGEIKIARICCANCA
jgi:hypothetical protein